jgi:predicted permease
MVDLDARRALPAGVESDGRLPAFFHEALQAVSEVHGVEAVSLSNFTPVSGGFWSQSVLVNGQATSEEEPPFFAISPGYFATMGIALRAGRDFTDRDNFGSAPVVIVNEEFVRRFVRGQSPLGQRVSAADSRFWKGMEIVGVAANAAPYSLREPVRPSVFVPFYQQTPERMGFGTLEIKAAGSLHGIGAVIEAVLRPRVPGLPVVVRSFTAQVENSIRREILMAELGGFFGALALMLAAIGVYGLLAYMVTRRTGEIGIRMALGAPRIAVIRMVLGDATRLVGIGLVAGLGLAWWGSSLVSTMLFGLKPTDALTISTSVLILTAVALAAGFIPARRASRVEPMTALRQE